MKKRIFVVFLALVICVAFSSFAFANEYLDDIMAHVKLDTKNTISFIEDLETDGYYDEAYFTIPVKGTVTLRFESKSKQMFTDTTVRVIGYESGAFSKAYDCITPKYSSSKKVYYYEKTLTLSKDDYVIGFECYASNLKPLNYWVNYKPSFGTTSITKVIRKKKGFTVKYSAASGATGYQVRYSRKSSMSGSKYASKTKDLYKTVSKLKTKKYYYVQVRAYKTMKVDGVTKTYYSKWSAKKKVKTK